MSGTGLRHDVGCELLESQEELKHVHRTGFHSASQAGTCGASQNKHLFSGHITQVELINHLRKQLALRVVYVLKCKITSDLCCSSGGSNRCVQPFINFSTCLKWMPTALKLRKKLGRGSGNPWGVVYNIRVLRSVSSDTHRHAYFLLDYWWKVRETMRDRHREWAFWIFLRIDHLLLS